MFEVFWCVNRHGEHRVRVQARMIEDDGTEREATFIAEGSIHDCLLFLSTFANAAKKAHDETVEREQALN